MVMYDKAEALGWNAGFNIAEVPLKREKNYINS